MKRILGMIIIFSIVVTAAYYGVVGVTENTNEKLSEAFKAYREGEHADTVSKRTRAFNKALSIYTDLEAQYSPTHGSGKLYYDIANSYYQVGKYSWAVLYYYRALSLMPHDERIERNLHQALQKLNIPIATKEPVFKNIFFFHFGLSVPERLRFFFIFAILALIGASLYIWMEHSWMKHGAILCALVACVFLLSLGYSHYVAPMEAVIVKSTALYRDAGTQYAKVLKEPVLSGTKVEVLDILQKGAWLKIRTPDDNLGYVPQDSIRVI